MSEHILHIALFGCAAFMVLVWGCTVTLKHSPVRIETCLKAGGSYQDGNCIRQGGAP